MSDAAITSPGEKLQLLMNFTKFINQFRSVRRTIWYKGNEQPENDGDHSFQVAMVCWFMNVICELGLDNNLIIPLALLHDLPEVYAKDTPNFPQPGEGGQLELFTKGEYEAAAIETIQQQWGNVFPELITIIEMYERQDTPEAQLVWALEKLLSVINIYQDDGRTWQTLQITISEMFDFQDQRLPRHPLTAELWDELKVLLQASPDLFFQAREY